MDIPFPDPYGELVTNTSSANDILTGKGIVKPLLAITKMGLTLAAGTQPKMVLLGIVVASGLNLVEKLLTKKGAKADTDDFTLDDVIKEIRDLGTNVDSLKKTLLSDLAAKHAVVAAKAVEEGEPAPYPHDIRGIYRRLFQFAKTPPDTYEAQAAAIQSLAQAVTNQTPVFEEQQPAPGLMDATLEAAYDLLSVGMQQMRQAVADVGQKVTAADQASQQRDYEMKGLLLQLLANQSDPSQTKPEESAADRRRRVLEEMAGEAGKPVEWLKQQIDLCVQHIREDPSADDRTRALAEFAAQHYGVASRLAQQSAHRLRRRREDREAHVQEQTALIQNEKVQERKDLTLAGDAEYEAGQYLEAILLYRQALALTEKTSDWDAWGDQAWKLSLVLQSLRQNAEAESLIRELLTEHTAREGGDSVNVISLSNNLANVLVTKGDLAGAEMLYRRVVEAQACGLGAEDPVTLGSVSNLANLLSQRGKLDEAESLYRQLRDVWLRTHGVDHPGALAAQNNLGIHLREKGALDEAASLLHYVLRVREHSLGSEHPDTLASLNNTASLYYAKGNLHRAEELFRQVLKAREVKLGAEHPDTLTSRNNLAVLLHDKGDLAEAELLFNQALEAQKRILEPDHPEMLATLNNLASLLRDLGKLAETEKIFRFVLEIRARTLGLEHVDTLASCYNLALRVGARKVWPESLMLLERVVAGRTKLLGAEHPDTVKVLKMVDAIKSNMGE